MTSTAFGPVNSPGRHAMTKSTVIKIFIGSLVAIAGGVSPLATA